MAPEMLVTSSPGFDKGHSPVSTNSLTPGGGIISPWDLLSVKNSLAMWTPGVMRLPIGPQPRRGAAGRLNHLYLRHVLWRRCGRSAA
ncbi:Hypothetical predicted protein [Pelobates cultripes]|uniref:Uncharacterized protein n=1 Tax=Pelobates cultripes TaxID=61616 RepID=A0AAD1R515_PELCU|nr:Hypothetical predicted protein [Pelobates cultripes]